jgi:hypothetical protein
MVICSLAFIASSAAAQPNTMYECIDVKSIPYTIEFMIGMTIEKLLESNNPVHTISEPSDLKFIEERVAKRTSAIRYRCDDIRIAALCYRRDGAVDTVAFGSLYFGFNGECRFLDTAFVRRVARVLPEEHRERLEEYLREASQAIQRYIEQDIGR